VSTVRIRCEYLFQRLNRFVVAASEKERQTHPSGGTQRKRVELLCALAFGDGFLESARNAERGRVPIVRACQTDHPAKLFCRRSHIEPIAPKSR